MTQFSTTDLRYTGQNKCRPIENRLNIIKDRINILSSGCVAYKLQTNHHNYAVYHVE